MRVRDVMAPATISIEPSRSLSHAAALMARHELGGLPVVRGDRLVGLVLGRDLDAAHPSPATSLTVAEIRGHLGTLPVEAVMVPDPMTIAPSTPLAEAARLMREGGVELLPVVERGQLVGVVTDAMLLRLLASLLSEDGTDTGIG